MGSFSAATAEETHGQTMSRPCPGSEIRCENKNFQGCPSVFDTDTQSKPLEKGRSGLRRAPCGPDPGLSGTMYVAEQDSFRVLHKTQEVSCGGSPPNREPGLGNGRGDAAGAANLSISFKTRSKTQPRSDSIRMRLFLVSMAAELRHKKTGCAAQPVGG